MEIRKLLVFFFSVVLLAGLAGAMSYQPIVFGTVNKGLDLTNQPMGADPDSMTVLDNFYVGIDRSSSQRLGAIAKVPGRATYKGTMEASGRSRGLFQFNYDTALSTLGGLTYSALINTITTNETRSNVYSLDLSSNIWTKLIGQNTTEAISSNAYHWSFAQNYDGFRRNDTLYFCNGGNFYKWFKDVTNEAAVASTISNTGATPGNLTGTVYFANGTDLATGSATSFLSEAPKGSWIKKDSSSPWYEVQYVTNNTSLRLRNGYAETDTSTTSAKVASTVTNVFPIFILNWKNRLWCYNNFGSTPWAGSSRLVCSAAFSSATPAALEDWSGSDSGYVDVPGESVVYGTGLIAVQDYLFCFKDTNYSVYQYDSSIVPPISLVKTWNYGCPAFRTLALVDNGVIYWTGTELRYTTGFQDVSLSAPVANNLRYQHASGAMASYYTLATSDNNMPQGVYDEINKIYHLYFSNSTLGTTTNYAYDWDKKIWIGNDKFNNVGVITKIYNTLTSVSNTLVYHPVSGGNQLYNIDTALPTTTTGEIQSSDLAFGDAKHQKKINWIEFWVHPPATTGGAGTTCETTLAFNYYADGKLALATPLTTIVKEDSGNNNYYKKVRFNISPTCTFFRWSLKDIGYENDGLPISYQLSILGGFIGFDTLDVN